MEKKVGYIYIENQDKAKAKITRRQLNVILKKDSRKFLSHEFDSALGHILEMPYQDHLEDELERLRKHKKIIFPKTCNICNAAIDITLQRGTPCSPMLDIDDVISHGVYGRNRKTIPVVHRICSQLRDAEMNGLDIVLSQNPLSQSKEW